MDFREYNAQPNDQKIATTGALLAQAPSFIDHIETIQSLVALPSEHYTLFYQTPLENFLAIYQPLPVDKIQLKLNNVIKALKLRRSHNLPLNVKPEDVREKKDIWTYTVFTAALLYKLPDIINYRILHTDKENSESYTLWNPYTGAIRSGHYYQVDVQPVKNKASMALTLFTTLFNQPCTTWLYSDPVAFNHILELILSPDPKSTLGHLIISSHNQSSQKHHVGHDLYYLLIEIIKGNIEGSDKINNCISLTHDGYAIAVPDIFNYYSSIIKEEASIIEECFYSLKKHTPSNYKVNFTNIGKKDALFIVDTEALL